VPVAIIDSVLEVVQLALLRVLALTVGEVEELQTVRAVRVPEKLFGHKQAILRLLVRVLVVAQVIHLVETEVYTAAAVVLVDH
jgi:hypothetical protein